MPLLPVSTTRTSTPLSTQRLLFQLNADQIALQRQYDQLSTGRRVLRLSDDPAAAGRAISLQRSIDRTNQLVRNANSTSAFYQTTDSSLDRVTAGLIEARGVSVQAAQTTLAADEREALALTIRQTLDSVVASGNSMFRDHQLLGGVLESENAFKFDGGSVLFGGTNAVGRAEFGAGSPNAIGVTGQEALGSFSPVVRGEQLNPALNGGTRLRDVNGGIGATPGELRISGGSTWQTVDLSSAATINDVVNVLESVEIDGRSLSVSVGPDSISIEYADGLPGILAIDDAVGGSLARDLFISNPGGLNAPPIVGNGLAPRLTTSTRISDLNGGAGADLSAGIRIQQGDKTVVVDLAGAETIGDVLIEINRSGADVQAELDEAQGTINLRALRSGVDYSIGENGGGAATALGIRSLTESTLLSDLGRGKGLSLNADGPDLAITRPDGVVLELELGSAQTVGEVMELIRNHPDNQDPGRVSVSFTSVGNGLQLEAASGLGSLRVSQAGLGNAGTRLGLIPEGSDVVQGSLQGGSDTVTGIDFLPLEAGGTFDTLLRLEKAVRDNDIGEITRLQKRLDVDLDRASQTRGKVGVWAQNLDALKEASETDVITLTAQKSNEIDADMATVISDLNQRQISLEASMRLIGQISQLTVLNFL